MFRKFSERIKKFWASAAVLSIEMLIILCLFILSFILFIFLITKVIILDRTELDHRVFDWVHSLVNDRNNELVQTITFFGSHEFLIPANLALIAYFLFIRKNKWYSIKIPAIALSSLALMFGLKRLFNRQRPDIPLLKEAAGLSFPSGHALFSITFYGLLIYMAYTTIKNNALKWSIISFLILFIGAIGFSRIYLRVHYTTDVIAGFCVGFIWLVIGITVLNRIERYSKKEFDKIVDDPNTPITTAD
ncbi:MAG TPA: phosphatase PAP2 family protein [Flavisolibacter sp.]|nr:phosphatase PAP2 family protein [Flavisolibacter sp.]